MREGDASPRERRLRILTIGNMYPPHSLGGYEIAWRSAVEHLRNVGHDVRVLTTDFRRPEVDAPDSSGAHRELRWYWRDHGFPRFGPRERLRLERHNAAVLTRHLDEFAPDLVSWWAMGGMSLSLIETLRRAGRPAAAGVVCDDWMIYGPRVDGWLRPFARRRRLGRAVERWTGVPTTVDLDSAGPWLFLSETLRSRARERGGLALTDSLVAHRGIEHDLFAPAAPKDWRWRLLYAGRIDPRKGIDLAIGALEHLPDTATLTIDGAGDPEYLSELGHLAERLGIAERVTFETRDRGELRAAYADADAVVFPARWDEPWGLVPLESMAVGTPVLATGRGGSGEYLEDERNCLLFDPEAGASGLATAVERLAADEPLRGQLRAGGLKTAAGLRAEDWNREVERLHLRAEEVGAR